jgi:hypothetical protein
MDGVDQNMGGNMLRKSRLLMFWIVFSLVILPACSAEPQIQVSYDPTSLRFDSQRAFELQGELAQQFPYRSSGQPNNRLAAEWINQQMTRYGWSCKIDEWTVINYSLPVDMNNVVCTLPGNSNKEILMVAHHDQSPSTIEGADNDASGIGILLELGRVFASERPLPYTMTFVSTDGEEYGMLGSRRYIQTHANPHDIIAGFSLDNLGKALYTGMKYENAGQFRKYGQIWLPLLARDVAKTASDLWTVQIRGPIDQVLDQAVPISQMDQGPMVAAGIPALGFAGVIPPESAALSWSTYHTPLDTMQYESADTLYQAGRIPEALIRQLLSMGSFPNAPGPYIYFDSSQQIFRGPALYAIFIGFVALFFLGGVFIGGRGLKGKLANWIDLLPHFLSVWLPLVASVLLLYLFVALGLMDKYEVYPATTKDPAIVSPHWPAVILFLLGLIAFFILSRKLVRRYYTDLTSPGFGMVKSLAFFIIGLAALYILLINPFSLLFLVPTLFWFLIKGRKGAGRVLDIVLFLLGFLIVYALLYFFGFVIQRSNFAVLWYIMMMFSIKEISFITASAITAIIAAGLSLVVNVPVKEQS